MADELLAVLKQARKDKKLGKELVGVMDKIRNEERLESHEFLKIYEILWKEGPSVGSTYYVDRLRLKKA